MLSEKFQAAFFGEALQQANRVSFLEGKLVFFVILFVAKQICKSFTARLVHFRAVGVPRLNLKLVFLEDGVNSDGVTSRVILTSRSVVEVTVISMISEVSDFFSPPARFMVR